MMAVFARRIGPPTGILNDPDPPAALRCNLRWGQFFAATTTNRPFPIIVQPNPLNDAVPDTASILRAVKLQPSVASGACALVATQGGR
jgi:hypothetical protein